MNNKTGNNSARPAAAALIVSIARLVAITLAILVAATPFKYNACKAAGGCAASSAT